MYSVEEAACKLGVSGARVRAMLKNGVLEGQKLGRAWAVSEHSVQQRLLVAPQAGRPKRRQDSAFERVMPNVDDAHSIYERAKGTLAGCAHAAFLDQAYSQEEQAFWISVGNFFMQQKQRELIAAGVY